MTDNRRVHRFSHNGPRLRISFLQLAQQTLSECQLLETLFAICNMCWRWWLLGVLCYVCCCYVDFNHLLCVYSYSELLVPQVLK